MTDFLKKASGHWQDSLIVILGVWLFFSPWALGFADLTNAFWNALVCGVVLAAAAFAAVIQFRQWEEWVDSAIGAWLAVSPFVLGFAAFGGEATMAAAVAATWNFILVGLASVLLAAWSLWGHEGAHA